MTEEQIRQHYPNCVTAVMVHEGLIVSDTESLALAEMFKLARAKGLSPGYVIQRLKMSADATLEMVPGGLMERMRPEMDHSDFLRYVQAKLRGT